MYEFNANDTKTFPELVAQLRKENTELKTELERHIRAVRILCKEKEELKRDISASSKPGIAALVALLQEEKGEMLAELDECRRTVQRLRDKMAELNRVMNVVEQEAPKTWHDLHLDILSSLNNMAELERQKR